MLPNNSLEKRLNTIKNGQPAPNPPSDVKIKHNTAKPITNIKLINKQTILNSSVALLINLSASLLYGFGIETIFNKSWAFMGILGVGFIINQVITIILKLFNKTL